MKLRIKSGILYVCGRGGGGGVEKWILKLTSAKVDVEVEAELGISMHIATICTR